MVSLVCAVAAMTPRADYPALANETVVVPFRSAWTVLSPLGFLDDPELMDPEFDTSWPAPHYDDAGWVGPEQGPFAYGRVDALRSSDPYPLGDPGDGDRYTNYFRHEFVTADSAAGLAIEFVADDGAVFYLDGQQVLRHNCCVDQFETPADDDYLVFADRPGNADSFVTRPILVGQTLPPGDHVLAVSVHQYATVSSALGFEMQLLSRETDQIVIDTGIDVTLAEAGLNGPDRPHGAAGQNPDGVERWEWDRVDAGGENQGLLWLDIPPTILDRFNHGSATLKLHVDNEGQAASLHRMTVDWLSGADGGDNVTWNNIPGGPGIVPGVNALDIAHSTTGDLIGSEGRVVEIDVTRDVLAWSLGEPNYGWSFLPTGGDAAAVASFENVFAPVPQLVIRPGDSEPFLQAGDADQDFDFDQLDLVQVQIASKYLSGRPATWGDGDWDGAPGGIMGLPPTGDGLFNQIDLIAALRHGLYRAGPYATVAPDGAAEDGQTLGYDARTGRLRVHAPADVELTSINVDLMYVPVPEPASGLVLALGLVSLIVLSLRRRLSLSRHA